MPTSTQSQNRNGLAGISVLVGFFCLFLALLFIAAGAYRTYREFLYNSWPAAEARVKKCALDIYHPFSRDGGGTTYSLRCAVTYDFRSSPYESDFSTISDRAKSTGIDIDNWTLDHLPGSNLHIKINPSDPKEFFVTSPLPIRQFATASEAWITAMAFSAFAGLLIAAGWKGFRRNLGQLTRTAREA